MARRFSKEDLFKGPPVLKKKFMVAILLRNMGDETFLVNEEIEAEYFEVREKEGLQLYDLDELGDPVYRAFFKEWVYVKEIRASEGAEKSERLLEE